MVNPTVAPRLEVCADQDGTRIGHVGPVHIVCYFATPTPQTLQLSHEHHVRLMAEQRHKTAVLSIICEGLSMPQANVRRAGAQLFREVAPQIACAANVIEGSGFWAATMRSIVTGVQLLSRAPCPNRTFSAVEEASDWIASHYRAFIVAPDVLAGAAAQLRAEPPA